MPTFALKMKAVLDGCSFGVEPEKFLFRIKFVCGCGNQFDKSSVFGFNDVTELPEGATCTFTQKCKDCKNVGQVQLLSTAADFSVKEDDSEKEVKVATMECRGITPSSFEVLDGYTVTSSSGHVWADVNLRDAVGENSESWTEYDEATETPVSVADITTSFELDKGGKKR